MGKHPLYFIFFTLTLLSSSAFSGTFSLLDGLTHENPSFFITQKETTTNLEETPLVRQHLTKIISDPEGGIIHHLVLELDENNAIVNINRETEGQDDKQVIKMTDLIKNPVVLARTSGRDILILNCVDCSVDRGGVFELKYLYNGITMQYRKINMNLGLLSDGSWQLFVPQEEEKTVIEWLRLVPRFVFGQLVGIKRILINVL